MVAPSKSKLGKASTAKTNQKYDSQIESILNRLHSGCRFVEYDETTNKDDDDDARIQTSNKKNPSNALSNVLRNASPPDEIHADLGRALAHSYVESLGAISSLLPTSSASSTDEKVKAAVERGDHIIESLCCGEDLSNDSGKNNRKIIIPRENYASVASTFFGVLVQSLFLAEGPLGEIGDDSMMAFVGFQWLKWCIRCEELSISTDERTSSIPANRAGGGGIYVLRACLKSYATVCLLNKVNDESKTDSGCAKVYESLTNSSTRNFWIRTYVNHVFELAQGRRNYKAVEKGVPSVVLLENVSPLFNTCVLLARHGPKQQKSQNQQQYPSFHLERQLLVKEVLRSCSVLLNDLALSQNLSNMKSDQNGRCDELVGQIADMVHYLSSSLLSYLNQIVHALSTLSSSSKHSGQSEVVGIMSLGYEWLRGVCDLMRIILMMESHYRKINNGNSRKNTTSKWVDVTNILSKSMNTIISSILPQFTSCITPFQLSFEMSFVYSTIAFCINSLPRLNRIEMANPVVAMRLGTLALNLHDDEEINLVCDMMACLFECMLDGESGEEKNLLNADPAIDPHFSCIWIGGILRTVGCIFHSRPECTSNSRRLQNYGESLMKRTNVSHSGERKIQVSSEECHMMDILLQSLKLGDTSSASSFDSLIGIISSSISRTAPTSIPLNSWKRRPLSPSDQNSGLILGLSLLHVSVSSPSVKQQVLLQNSLKFLRSFLQCYPRLASRSVPSIVDTIRICIMTQQQQIHASSLTLQPTTNETILSLMRFLASPSIVSDPHGAHVAWTFFSSLTDEGNPSAVRSTSIRILAEMCQSNKKLFRRIRNVIGKAILSRDPMIRMAAAATLSDLAKFDLLRDVEDVIPLIQNNLTDEEPAVVHYSLLTLRYLVQNEELDFALVIRVLEKRLGVNLLDYSGVLRMDDLVVEALVMLLGEGSVEEIEEEDDSEDDDDRGDPKISTQLANSVSFLIDLSNGLPIFSKNDNDGEQISPNERERDLFAKARIQMQIYSSLSNYSPIIIGLDQESIRSWDGADLSGIDSGDCLPEVKRFVEIKQLAMAGVNDAMLLLNLEGDFGEDGMHLKEMALGLLNCSTKIMKNILHFEDEVHGSSLFRLTSSRGSSDVVKKKHDSRISKSILSLLPTAETIQTLFEDDPRSPSATALLFTLGANSDNDTLPTSTDLTSQISECFGDLFNEPLVDPPFHAIQIGAIMSTMNKVWLLIEDAEESVRIELFDQVVAEIDQCGSMSEYAYVALAAFSLEVDGSPQLYAGVTNIQNKILEGRQNYLFETEDCKLLSVSMIAGRLSRTADARVAQLIDFIEKSITEHTGTTSFGAFFGLGIIAENLMSDDIMNGADPSETWRRRQAQRIISIFMTELNRCLEEENETLVDFVSNLKRSHTTPDLLLSCDQLSTLQVKDNSIQKIRGLLIGFVRSFPMLSAISPKLMKCVLFIIDKLPWGVGKGFVLHSAYNVCLESKVIEQVQLSNAIETTSTFIERCYDEGVDYGDALFALASMTRIASGKGNKKGSLVKDAVARVKDGHSSEGKSIVLAGCALIGDIPGIQSLLPKINVKAKKDDVSVVVSVLDDIASDQDSESKLRDASTILLGVLYAMRFLPTKVHSQKSTSESKGDSRRIDVIQAKDGSLTQSILQEIANETNKTFNDAKVQATSAKKLSVFLSALEQMTMPGSFSKVIEISLQDYPITNKELKSSAMKFLLSQLESRRRIGFDGRGFMDLATRLAKMPPDKFYNLVGQDAYPIIMETLPNLVYQLPTSIGEEVAKNLWDNCNTGSNVMLSLRNKNVFLVALNSVLMTAHKQEKSSSKHSIYSPALLKALQKLVVADIFDDVCNDVKNSPEAEIVWKSYVQCLDMVPGGTVSEAASVKSDISNQNVFMLSICAKVLSIKSTSSSYSLVRKIEHWIARQEWDDSSVASLQFHLMPSILLAPQCLNDIEMKDSVISLFEVMLVKGVGTLCLHLLAAKVTYWWESQVDNLNFVDMPIQTKLSSFFIASDMCFELHNLSAEQVHSVFDSIISDFPPKLAVLCQQWGIADDIANKARRISSSCQPNLGDQRQQICLSLSCIEHIVELLDGGETKA